LLKKH